MLDISISSTKVKGRPKGRPSDKPNKRSNQIIYPEKLYPYSQIKMYSWQTGVIYRKASGFPETFKTRHQGDV